MTTTTSLAELREIIVDMTKERRSHQQLTVCESEVKRVSSFKFLGVHNSDDLTVVSCITVWYGNSINMDCKRLQREW